MNEFFLNHSDLWEEQIKYETYQLRIYLMTDWYVNERPINRCSRICTEFSTAFIVQLTRGIHCPQQNHFKCTGYPRPGIFSLGIWGQIILFCGRMFWAYRVFSNNPKLFRDATWPQPPYWQPAMCPDTVKCPPGDKITPGWELLS